jgi:hypothetical protein
MAEAVNRFAQRLNERLGASPQLGAVAWSTGDGAIVSIGRQRPVTTKDVRDFFDFVVGFTNEMIGEGLILRAAVNSAEAERFVDLPPGGALQGQFIQVGDTINVAARILTFTDPREIMVSDEFWRLLRRLDISEHVFLANDPLITKHGEVLLTHTLEPKRSVHSNLYSPSDSSFHAYKKYHYFPPITGETIDYFQRIGLDAELRKLVAYAFESISEISETHSLVSWNQVLNVLTNLTYDPDDTVYVLWRAERAVNFWTQARIRTYLKYLRDHIDSDGHINQIRVRTYADENNFENMRSGDMLNQLQPLHKPGTLWGFPISRLSGAAQYERLSKLIFGVTISTKYQYAIIPVPAPEAVGQSHISTRDLEAGDRLRIYGDGQYEQSDGPMKAIITANRTYVANLIAEFSELLRDPQREDLFPPAQPLGNGG